MQIQSGRTVHLTSLLIISDFFYLFLSFWQRQYLEQALSSIKVNPVSRKICLGEDRGVYKGYL
jgi:hypothetical protein